MATMQSYFEDFKEILMQIGSWLLRTENRLYVFNFEEISGTTGLTERSIQMRNNGEISSVQVVARDVAGSLSLEAVEYRIVNGNMNISFSQPARENLNVDDYVRFDTWRTDQSHCGFGSGYFPGLKYTGKTELKVQIQPTVDIAGKVIHAQVVIFTRESITK